jgi:hypothetical protein
MQLILPAPLEDTAEAISRDDMTMYESLLAEGVLTRTTAINRDNIQPVAELHIGLIQYLGGAYHLRDAERFRKAVSMHLSLAEWLVERFEPEPRHLLVDLCLSVINGSSQTRRSLARAILTAPGGVDIHDEAGLLATILAATSDLDRGRAALEIARLRNACVARTFPRLRTRALIAFAIGAREINAGTTTRFASWLLRMDSSRLASIVKELTRAQRGESTAITAASFIDLPAAALASLAASRLRRRDGDTFPKTFFSDYRWIAEAGWA